MSELRLLPDGERDRAIVVWPAAEAIQPGLIQEAREHLFELTGEPDAAAADLLIDDQPLDALRVREPGCARWRWSPGFHAGAVSCELRVGARRHTFEVVTDPAERKLTRDDFDTMLREILEDSLALFALTPFRRGIARGEGERPPPVARLEFLRSRLEEIERVVRAIDAAPRRVLRGDTVVRPPHLARGVTGPEVLASLRSGRLLQASHPGRLPAGLKGRLPAQIRMRRRVSSLDLPEHRQMKACLAMWQAWLERAAIQLGRSAREDAAAALWARRARLMARRLGRLLQLSLFEGVGEALPRPVMSALWRGDARYRRFMELWRDASRGLARVFGDFLQMPLARTFDLYELWCYLRLVRAAAERFGEGAELSSLFIESRDGVTLAANAVNVSFPQAGFSLCFQKRYREFWLEADGRGSFSRPMQPDIVVDATGAGRLIVLDAKYRIGADLAEALSSAHMYRDAIVASDADGRVSDMVQAAYLLTPDAASPERDWRRTALPARLFHPEYRAVFRFGALTLRPGAGLNAAATALSLVLVDAGVEVA